MLALGVGATFNVVAAPSFPEAPYRKHVEVLASDAFEGRAPGTEGEKKTVDYIEQQFKAAGLEGAIDGSFRQPVPVAEIKPHADPTLQVTGAGGKSLALAVLDDVVVWTKRPVPESRIRNAEIVYAGYGIVAPEYGWDDYAGLDVRGKLVLALVNDPGFATQDPTLFTGNAMTYYGRWDYKFAEAVRRGAAGVLVVHETKAAGYPWDVPRNGATKAQFDLRIDDFESQRLPIEGWITEDAASRVLALAGKDFATLKAASSKRGFKAQAARARGERRRQERRAVQDVVQRRRHAAGPRTTRRRRSSTPRTGITWAVDTNPKPGEDAIYNGAQDNATGIAGLIELARAFAKTRPRPQRSMLFVAVTAEESGLLGSEYFVAHPPLPVSQMAGGLNMDNLYAVGPDAGPDRDRFRQVRARGRRCGALRRSRVAC